MTTSNADALRVTRRGNRDAVRPTVEGCPPIPDPRLVALVSWAVSAVLPRVYGDEYEPWRRWAASWDAGERNPRVCVEAGRWCFSHRGWGDGRGVDPAYHALGQIAWAAKEACYTEPGSGWLVVRYIGDAMIAWGVAFPHDLALTAPALPAPSKRRASESGRPRP